MDQMLQIDGIWDLKKYHSVYVYILQHIFISLGQAHAVDQMRNLSASDKQPVPAFH